VRNWLDRSEQIGAIVEIGSFAANDIAARNNLD
jgi:hypothetical protein